MAIRAQLQQMFNPAMIATQALTGLPIGQLKAASAPSTGATTFNLTITVPAWVVNGMPVWDVTTAQLLGKVSTTSGVQITMAANSAFAGSIGDVIQFGFTPSDLAAGEAAGRDIQGAVQLCIVKANEIAQLMSDLNTDVITSGQDSTLNTLLVAIAAAL